MSPPTVKSDWCVWVYYPTWQDYIPGLSRAWTARCQAVVVWHQNVSDDDVHC